MGALFSSWLRRAPPAFTAYETLVIEAIAAELGAAARARFAQRLAAITHLRRADGGRRIALDQKQGGRRLFPAATRLSEDDGETLLARFTVTSRRTLSALQGKAWLTDGNLSLLTFTQPTEHAQCDDVHRISVKLDDAMIVADTRKDSDLIIDQ